MTIPGLYDDDEQIMQKLSQLPPHELVVLKWHLQRYPKQTPPDPLPFIWFLLGGRGSGKTLTGANHVYEMAKNIRTPPGKPIRVALISETHQDVKNTMIEGEALALDTLVATPHGMVPIGDIQTGDVILGGNGNPCEVVKAWDVLTDRPCFKITLDGGQTIIADANHKWLVEDFNTRAYNNRYQGNKPASVLTTSDLIPKLKKTNGQANYAIRVSEVHSSEVDLPLDPYLFGVWLGDGKSNNSEITTMDPEIVAAFASAGFEPVKYKSENSGKAAQYNFLGLRPVLNKMGALTTKGEKTVPEVYFQGSYKQRLALLQGLMDTDGSITSSNQCEFANVNLKLHEAVIRLSGSLGIKANATKIRIPGVKVFPNGEHLCKDYGVTKFTTSVPVFRLERKDSRIPSICRDENYWYIHSVVSIESVPVRCLTVNSSDSTYLITNHHIKTHNTGLRSIIPRDMELAWNRSMGEYRIAIPGPIYKEIHFKAFSSETPEQLRGPQHHICFPAGTMVRTPTPMGETPIESIREGDLVHTRFGPRRVLATTLTPAPQSSLIQIEHTLGELTGTPDHPVWVKGTGWTPLKLIKPCDILMVWRDEKTGYLTTEDTPTTTPRQEKYGGIGEYGRTATHPSLATTKSTTSTKSLGMIDWKTFNSSHPVSIVVYTLPNVNQLSAAYVEKSLNSLLWELEPNTVQLVKAELTNLLAKRTNMFASPVGVRLETVALTQDSVVKSVSTLADVGTVYNLTVEEFPEYFANNILVHNCWLDEPAKLKDSDKEPTDPSTTFSNMMMGLRLGDNPHCIVTGTPEPHKLIKYLVDHPDCVTHVMPSTDNWANLPQHTRAQMERLPKTSRTYRQEVLAEILLDNPDSIFSQEKIEEFRADPPPDTDDEPALRLVLGYDPSMTSNAESDETGIILGGFTVTEEGKEKHIDAYILEDHSGHLDPTQQAKTVTDLIMQKEIPEVIIEQNQGADFVLNIIKSTLQNHPDVSEFYERQMKKKATKAGTIKRWRITIIYKDKNRPHHSFILHAIHAKIGKALRADSVAIRYEVGQVHHPTNGLPICSVQTCRASLEDQMVLWDGSKKDSPDRMDAATYVLMHIFGEEHALSAKRPSRIHTPAQADNLPSYNPLTNTNDVVRGKLSKHSRAYTADISGGSNNDYSDRPSIAGPRRI